MNVRSFKTFFPVLLIVSVFTACNNESTNTGENADTTSTTTTESTNENEARAQAVLSGTQSDTTVTGTVNFKEDDGKVEMKLEITVPKKANSSVAVHIHEHGSCGDMGKEAHGHWNPTNENHGKWGTAPFHRGDIGNVKLDGEGKGTLELETDLWTISGSDTTKNILNKAIIVHGGEDDFKTQPTGNAGSRIGCGVITKS
ncbi:MAG TPA: superoxide dismutase family protein [Flavisolibacter sp.]|nr:superoxide dismutase family protein [Flavisolibacter sp.]